MEVELVLDDALVAQEALRCMSQTLPLKSRSLAEILVYELAIHFDIWSMNLLLNCDQIYNNVLSNCSSIITKLL